MYGSQDEKASPDRRIGGSDLKLCRPNGGEVSGLELLVPAIENNLRTIESLPEVKVFIGK